MKAKYEPFVMTRRDIVQSNLNTYCKTILEYITSHKESFYLSVAKIAKVVGFHRNTVSKRIGQLIKMGYIKRTFMGSKFSSKGSLFKVLVRVRPIINKETIEKPFFKKKKPKENPPVHRAHRQLYTGSTGDLYTGCAHNKINNKNNKSFPVKGVLTPLTTEFLQQKFSGIRKLL